MFQYNTYPMKFNQIKLISQKLLKASHLTFELLNIHSINYDLYIVNLPY